MGLHLNNYLVQTATRTPSSSPYSFFYLKATPSEAIHSPPPLPNQTFPTKNKTLFLPPLSSSSVFSTINKHIFSPPPSWFLVQFPMVMGSSERSKKRVQLWKKAIVQFSLCFVMGFFMGFAPGGKALFFPTNAALNQSHFSPQRAEMLHSSATTLNSNGSTSMAETPAGELETAEGLQPEDGGEDEAKLSPRRLLIIVTPAGSENPARAVLLRRLAYTLRLVPPPLLWIVVEAQTDSSEVSETLRRTGIMYRHLVSVENFTEPAAELEHQRNLALSHIEHHKLSGIVHFAALSTVYDLDFFDEIRDIEVFGAWPVAWLSANKNKVIMEGPVCDSSQVIGWHLKKVNNETELTTSTLQISGFSFNSSILWDPERWGRPSSVQDNSQNSIKFVKEVALEDESKLKGIPQEDCSRIMLWNLNIPVETRPRYHQRSTPSKEGRPTMMSMKEQV